MFSGIFLVEMASFMILSQYRDTKAIFYLFHKITKIFPSCLTSFISLYSNTKWKWRQPCLNTLRENEARLIKACVGRVLFYNEFKIALMKKINEAQVDRWRNNVSKWPYGRLYFVINILEFVFCFFFAYVTVSKSVVLLLMYFNSVCNTRQSG